ncbi:VIT1/CCC1 transporter family protein [Streptomyces sp. SP17BM10]|uniref:VIT1/CCC1 transporter family protein n=1 Tax=Streptomyces sp. SP17BM10 TaxID=3002530 RepID=UPI002E7A75D4|nr:VIT1/CCC1 transporter family protein [Streptomyces sp. SP17BM10]MEE1787837.1 VIT1/CCC1 transporter family protein [Streptomyces sp. SP17BM10]
MSAVRNRPRPHGVSKGRFRSLSWAGPSVLWGTVGEGLIFARWGWAGLLVGATSMAAGEYVSVSTQRDTERAVLAKGQQELTEEPEGEADGPTDPYRGSGLGDGLAREVAAVPTELGIDPEVLTDPWQAVPALSGWTSARLGGVGRAGGARCCRRGPDRFTG